MLLQERHRSIEKEPTEEEARQVQNQHEVSKIPFQNSKGSFERDDDTTTQRGKGGRGVCVCVCGVIRKGARGTYISIEHFIPHLY